MTVTATLSTMNIEIISSAMNDVIAGISCVLCFLVCLARMEEARFHPGQAVGE